MWTNYCIWTIEIVTINLCFFWCESTLIRNVIKIVETIAFCHKNNSVWFSKMITLNSFWTRTKKLLLVQVIRKWSNLDYILTMGSFVQVTSCDLPVDNKLFERWNYDIMISLNLLFRTLLWFFLYQDMEGNIDWLDCTAAVISLSSSYLMQIF